KPVQKRVSLIVVFPALFWKWQQFAKVRLAEKDSGGDSGVASFITRGFRHFERGTLPRIHTRRVYMRPGFGVGFFQCSFHGLISPVDGC
ncbi:MAG: hypothetical protein NTY98_01780, partial [Verrucomicrobia bacterium]|nr:hypothetical protein [Verrucomicrobiota bacterium]